MREIQTNAEGLRLTPLYNYYTEELGASVVDFAGWALPIQITSIKEEHEAVRNGVGLFDASHMGEVRVSGEGALEWLNGMVTNDIMQTADGQAIYTAVTNDEGYTLDDLIIYKNSAEDLMLTPNSGNYEKIYAWLQDHNDGEVEITNESAEFGLIAVQGPKAQETLAKLTDADLDSIKGYHFSKPHTVAGVDNVVISRTGYTGEDGFELYIPWDSTVEIWKALVAEGAYECALGARDTLRLEAGLALYGNDLSEEINPVAGGIGFAVKTGDKKETDYPGKAALEAYKAKDKSEKLISRGFELTGKGIARQGYKVKNQAGEYIGEVTSGTKSPSFGTSLGFMLLKQDEADLGTEVLVEVRKKDVPAVLVKKDWLRR